MDTEKPTGPYRMSVRPKTAEGNPVAGWLQTEEKDWSRQGAIDMAENYMAKHPDQEACIADSGGQVIWPEVDGNEVRKRLGLPPA